MTISKQLYANNAGTTLNGALTNVATSINVVSGTSFPVPTAGQYFLVTLDNGVGGLEIVKVTVNSGNVFSGVSRGQEGTTALAFASGVKAELRVTRDTLANFTRFQDRNTEIATIGLMDTPAKSDSNTYIIHSNDSFGTPIAAVYDTASKWRFFTHQITKTTFTATSGTSTTLAASSTNLSTTTLPGLAAGKYLMQFTSGANIGLCRILTAVGSGTAGWTEALPNVVIAGDTAEVYISNSTSLNTVVNTDFSAFVSTISPAFTGSPTAPTQIPATNNTTLATTAYVTNAVLAASSGVVGATVAPLMDGTAAIGVATKYAREDHVHASDTSKQAALGYAPVQQGTGIGQFGNVVKIGWSGARLKATVDTTDLGNMVMDSDLVLGYLPLAGGSMTGPLTIYNSGTPTTGRLYMGNSGAKYLDYTSTNFNFVGSPLQNNGTQVAILGANTFTADQTYGGFKLVNAATSGARSNIVVSLITGHFLNLDISSGYAQVFMTTFVSIVGLTGSLFSSASSQNCIVDLVSTGGGYGISWPNGGGTGVGDLLFIWTNGVRPDLSLVPSGKHTLVRMQSIGQYTWVCEVLGSTKKTYATLQDFSAPSINLWKGALGFYSYGSDPSEIKYNSTIPFITTGTWYWEVSLDTNFRPKIGFEATSYAGATSLGNVADSVCIDTSTGNMLLNAVSTAYTTPFVTGDIVGIFIDTVLMTVSFSKNGAFLGDFSISGFSTTNVIVAISSKIGSIGGGCSVNFGPNLKYFPYNPNSVKIYSEGIYAY